MKAEAIVNRILEDARAQANQTIEEARRRAEQLRDSNEEQLEKRRESEMAAARKECEQIRDRMLRMAELERKKSTLAMKREVIDLAFDDALRRLRAMPREQARAFMGGLIAQAAQGGEEVVVDKADAAAFDASFVEQIAQNTGKPLTRCSRTQALGGGVLLRRDGLEINLTYPAILAERRAALEAEAARVLFAPEKG